MKRRLAGIAGLVGALLASGLARADMQLNLHQPQTAVAQQMYDLHTIIMVVCVVIFVGVFGVMFYSIFAHRRSVGHQAAQFHESTFIEILWTVIPVLILVGIAVKATGTVLEMKDTRNPDITIKVTGYQWKWGYEYLSGEGAGIQFLSQLSTPRAQIEGKEPRGPHYLLEVDNPVVVPVGKKIRIVTTAADVIHAWWIPAFGVKQDAIPGFVRDTWFRADKVGTYRGQCAELCGKEHGFMPIVVEVKSEADYKAWVAAHAPAKVAAAAPATAVSGAHEAAPAAGPAGDASAGDLVAAGEKVYGKFCVACHQANGKGIPGTFPPIDGSKVATGPLDEHIKVVLAGRPGTPMNAWAQLSDEDVAAVVTYQRNSWGNKTGDAVKPAQVQALRK